MKKILFLISILFASCASFAQDISSKPTTQPYVILKTENRIVVKETKIGLNEINKYYKEYTDRKPAVEYSPEIKAFINNTKLNDKDNVRLSSKGATLESLAEKRFRINKMVEEMEKSSIDFSGPLQKISKGISTVDIGVTNNNESRNVIIETTIPLENFNKKYNDIVNISGKIVDFKVSLEEYDFPMGKEIKKVKKMTVRITVEFAVVK